MKKMFIFLFVFAAFLPADALARDTAGYARLEIEEKIGRKVPLDTTFYDEEGKSVRLRDIIRRPAVISLVYLSCTRNCPLLLGGLAQAVEKLDLDPSRDYSLVTVSFDENDTPAVAREKKRNYIKAVGKPFPETSWTFLTGDAEYVGKLTGAVGFPFRKEKGGFSHPRALIIVSSDGAVARYLYGTNFSSFDLEMALAEASRGTGRSAYRSLLLYCFEYDPLEKKYVFNTARVFLTVISLSAFCLTVFWAATSGKFSGGRRSWKAKT
jgi:protein SCO1/2